MPVAEQTRHREATVSAADLVLLDEADRAAIAAGLHDGLLQELLGARLLVDLVQRDPVATETPARLAELRTALSEAIRLGRAAMAELHSAGVLRSGLETALTELAARAGAPLTVDIHGDAASATGAAAVLAYRLAEAARAAGAAPVSLAVEAVPGALRVVATADGLSCAAPSLARVLQRVEALGGTVTERPDVAEAWIPLESGDPR